MVIVPDSIVLHHSLTKDGQTVSAPAIRKWHMGLHPESPYVNKPMKDIGYHWIIELIAERYEILAGRMMTEVGAHCTQEGMNRRSIGILLVGNFDLASPPPEMWALAVRFVWSLAATIRIPIHRIFGHREFASYKTCPGSKFDLGKFRNDLAVYSL